MGSGASQKEGPPVFDLSDTPGQDDAAMRVFERLLLTDRQLQAYYEHFCLGATDEGACSQLSCRM